MFSLVGEELADLVQQKREYSFKRVTNELVSLPLSLPSPISRDISSSDTSFNVGAHSSSSAAF
jgi:hypothetical protein